MTLDRRDFLFLGSGLVAGAACAGTVGEPGAQTGSGRATGVAGHAGTRIAAAGDGLDSVRAEFEVDPEYMHFTAFKLAPHPRVVREAIARHRRGLDRNPIAYLQKRHALDRQVRTAAGEFLAVESDDIALTDSTTMGLGLLYGGFMLRPGQELVYSVHDHYATREALRSRASRDGARLREITLYDDSARVTRDELVARAMAAVTDKTRILAITWVHSSSGVKLPVRDIADALAERNRGRAEAERTLLCVDGVQGMGVESFTMAELGCDFFVAGTHKWLFGPRGTGIMWGKKSLWKYVLPMIPPFESPARGAFIDGDVPPRLPGGVMTTPGGYHSFEHRWALAEAFAFQKGIGRDKIERHSHELARQLKEGLRAMKHVKLHTPMDEQLSAGFVMFDVNGLTPREVVIALFKRKIISSKTPYKTSFARLAPSLLNDASHVEAALRAVRELA